MFDLHGRTALITGGSRGIGRALALGFARAGADVALADVADTAETERLISAQSDRQPLGVRADVTDISSLNAAAGAVVRRFGGLDILVNNAGFYAGMTRAPLTELSDAEWDRMLAINVKGVWNATRAAVPHMQRAGYGKIVNISSTTIFIGQPNMLHYIASKGAVFAMTRSMARELGPFGIRVNTVAPGLTLTDASIESFAGGREDQAERVAAMTALRRTQSPDDLVGTVLYLSSAASDAMTGQALNVDNGIVHW